MAVRSGWWVSPQQVVVSAELGWSLISFQDDRLESSDDELELTLGGLAQVYLSRLFWVGGGAGLAVYSTATGSFVNRYAKGNLRWPSKSSEQAPGIARITLPIRARSSG